MFAGNISRPCSLIFQRTTKTNSNYNRPWQKPKFLRYWATLLLSALSNTFVFYRIAIGWVLLCYPWRGTSASLYGCEIQHINFEFMTSKLHFSNSSASLQSWRPVVSCFRYISLKLNCINLFIGHLFFFLILINIILNQGQMNLL